MGKTTKKILELNSEYISPEELAIRWRCARSSVDRIVRRAGFSRLILGTGKNGMIRFLRAEILAYESKCLIRQ